MFVLVEVVIKKGGQVLSITLLRVTLSRYLNMINTRTIPHLRCHSHLINMKASSCMEDDCYGVDDVEALRVDTLEFYD